MTSLLNFTPPPKLHSIFLISLLRLDDETSGASTTSASQRLRAEAPLSGCLPAHKDQNLLQGLVSSTSADHPPPHPGGAAPGCRLEATWVRRPAHREANSHEFECSGGRASSRFYTQRTSSLLVEVFAVVGSTSSSSTGASRTSSSCGGQGTLSRREQSRAGQGRAEEKGGGGASVRTEEETTVKRRSWLVETVTQSAERC